MTWEIVWSEFAEKKLDGIFEYYQENASTEVASKLMVDIITEANRLYKHKNLGQKEAQLLGLSTEYRYLVYKSFKIIYSIDETGMLIKIADVFDTRQYPRKIERGK